VSGARAGRGRAPGAGGGARSGFIGPLREPSALKMRRRRKAIDWNAGGRSAVVRPDGWIEL